METLQTRATAYPTEDEPPRGAPEVAPAPDRAPRRAHWRAWIALVVAIVVVRLSVPILLAPMLATRLSRVLGTPVEIGDVGLAPIDGVIMLYDVTVQALDGTRDVPAIAARRVRIDVQWLPLLHRALLVRELAFESAQLELDRLTGDGSSVETLLRANPASELPPDWTFALDRIVLRNARLRLLDVATGESAVEVDLREARVSTRPQRASAFGRAPNLRVDAVMDQGRVRIDGSSDLRDDGLMVDAHIRATAVPLARLQSYLPDFGWSAVTGGVSGQLHYQREPGRRDRLTGGLLLRGVAVHVPALTEPALAIPKAVVDVHAIDLGSRRVTIGDLTLRGATLAVRPDLSAPLPLLDGADTTFGVPVAPRPGGAARTAGAGATPWRWTVARLQTPDARVHVAGRDGPATLIANVAGENLGPGAFWSPLRAWVRRGEGAAAFDGTLRMTHGLVIEGRLTAGGVDAPAFARAVGLPWAELALLGRGAADLNVELAPGVVGEPPLDVRGKLSVTDLWLAGEDPTAFAVGAGALDLQLRGLLPARSEGDLIRPAELRISAATARAPYVLLTRTPEGWLLPPAMPESEVQLVAAALRASGGRIVVVDAAAPPVVAVDLAVSEAWVRNLRLPAGTFDDFVLAGSDRRLGVVRVGGVRGLAGRELELTGQTVPLAEATPYFLRAGLPYRFDGGTGSFHARVALAGAQWSADTMLTMRAPIVGGDDTTLRQALGTSVEDALAGLRDPSGDVTLQLALTSAGIGNPQVFADAVARAVRDAVTLARQNPLPDPPAQIAFATGRTDPTVTGGRQIATIAEILVARPTLIVELTAPISTDDRQWLAAQALADEMEPPGGFMGVLGAFGVRDARERIRRALAARAAGEPGRLDADDEAALEDMLAQRPPVDGSRLAALADARLLRIVDELAERHDIARARIRVVEPSDESAGPPAVRVKIGPDPRPLQAPLP